MTQLPDGGQGPIYGPRGTGPGQPIGSGADDASATHPDADGQSDFEPPEYPPPAYPPPYGQQPYGQQPYGQQPYGQQPYGQLVYHGADPAAPYGRDPLTGEPLSDKSKVVAGVLQILLGAFGAGRFYTGHTGIAIAQIVVTWGLCGLGAVWPVIDGIVMLAGTVRDRQGRKLRA